MKVSGFAQLRNELSQGNLINWFKCMDAVCDNIFIYDQNSTDGSLEEYARHPNTYVIQSPINDFANEIRCKSMLLEYLLAKSPDTEWIFWMDGDAILDGESLKPGVFKNTLAPLDKRFDSIMFGHYNLWRSDIHYRTDNLYHDINTHGVCACWRNNGRLYFPKKSGLHLSQAPFGLWHVLRVNMALLHRGFATDVGIVNKYINYRSRGQSGYLLDRLIDETTLTVDKLDTVSLPDWFEASNTVDPTTRPKLVDLYKGVKVLV